MALFKVHVYGWNVFIRLHFKLKAKQLFPAVNIFEQLIWFWEVLVGNEKEAVSHRGNVETNMGK